MGKYNGAIITTAGQNLIAEAIAGAGTVTFTTLQTSSHQYPASTNFQALTALDDVEQTVNISGVTVFDGNIVQVSANVSNTGVPANYYIRALGVFGQLGSAAPVLVAVITAINPDEMPADDPLSPSSFLYNIQMTIQNADQINVTVTAAGTVTVPQLEVALEDYVQKTSVVNNLITTEEGFVLDARQGKALKDEVDEIDTFLAGDAGWIRHAVGVPFWYMKKGNVGFLSIVSRGIPSIPANTWMVINSIAIPEAYRTQGEIFFPGWLANAEGTAAKPCLMYFSGGTGIIQVLSHETLNNWLLTAYAAYPIKSS